MHISIIKNRPKSGFFPDFWGKKIQICHNFFFKVFLRYRLKKNYEEICPILEELPVSPDMDDIKDAIEDLHFQGKYIKIQHKGHVGISGKNSSEFSPVTTFFF